MKLKYPKYSLILLLVLMIVAYAGCDKDNPDLIPAYLRIDTIQMVSNPNLQHLEGSLSHNITDAWIFVDGDYLGTYELPATFPILKEGIHTLEVKAGIKLNGISNTRAFYKFYEPWSAEINFVKDSVLEVKPVVSYRDITNFVWTEDFEDGHSSIVPSSRSDTIVELTDDPDKVFEGNYSGIIHLDESRFLFEGFSSEGYELPVGQDVFLELDFKVNNPTLVGLLVNEYGTSVQSSVIFLNPKDDWTKIYINMTNVIGSHPGALFFNVYFQVLKQNEVSFPEVILDNIKLVY